ncbi:Rv3654c family TadE-like protein [Streptomyces acidiscabies]|uniref:Rv3654c family TadE-like protein n=1 Tax=Streptomyces acidiscabies TaxID=42234 RepID=UPI0038F69BA6
MKRGCRDRGSASVWGVVAVAVLCAVFGAVLALGQAVVVRHRAAGGADLAALAGAGRALEGAGRACERARGVARAQGGRVVRCSVAGGVVDLTVVVGAGPFEAEGRARAGVVEEGGG